MTEIESLVDSFNKMSLLLGMATSTLIELSIDDRLPLDRVEGIKAILDRLLPGIDEIYYKKYKIDK
jgi:hypothetical protein